MNYYEMIVKYDCEYSEWIVFADKRIAFSTNDIIEFAVARGLLEEAYRGRVCLAWSITKYEYEYIKQK